MNHLEVTFWCALACVLYTYAGYPLLLACRARLYPHPPRRGDFQGSFTILLSCRNEETAITRRLEELIGHIRTSARLGDIVVISDGSTDATAARAGAFAGTGLVQVLELKENIGKAAALTMGCHLARGEILLFADVRQTWADDAIAKLLENFADPQLGAVSGDLVLHTQAGVLAGVGLYWRFEKWLRQQESLVHAQVGVTGAIAAVRRELFRPIPAGTVLDDVYWPMQVAMQGFRVIHDARALAHDRLPEKPRDEFRRKVRTLSGNFQLACRLPSSLLPWRNPVWLPWLSHKLLRLVMPWALLATLTASAVLTGPWFTAAFWSQVAGCTLALLGLIPPLGRRSRLLGAAASFLVLNAAAWLAFWVWLTRRAGRSWRKAGYDVAPVSQEVQEQACSLP